MDPQCDDKWLTITRTVEMYVRCGFDRERVWWWLNNLYWRGEFEPYARRSPANYPMTPRREMLAVLRDYDHPGILFSPSELPTERGDDGSIMLDARKCIVLPEQTDAWTDQHCNDAYRILAHVDRSDIAPECEAGLMCQYIGRYELAAISAKWDTGPVPFCRRHKASMAIDRLTNCARLASWFQCKIDAHVRVTRPEFDAVAKEEFSISGRDVDEVWVDLAPEKFKSPGRPPGSKNRH